jgi:hypothetical protein
MKTKHVSIYRLVEWPCITLEENRTSFNSQSNHNVVFLPGFQKVRVIEASQGKGQGAVLAQKRAICVVQGKT